MTKTYYLVVHPNWSAKNILERIEDEGQDEGVYFQHWTSALDATEDLERAVSLKDLLVKNGNPRKIVKYTQQIEEVSDEQ